MAKTFDAVQAQRDLNPHAEARAAMWLFSKNYVASGYGSMKFYDLLAESDKRLCRRMVDDITTAIDSNGREPQPLTSGEPT